MADINAFLEEIYNVLKSKYYKDALEALLSLDILITAYNSGIFKFKNLKVSEIFYMLRTFQMDKSLSDNEMFDLLNIVSNKFKDDNDKGQTPDTVQTQTELYDSLKFQPRPVSYPESYQEAKERARKTKER